LECGGLTPLSIGQTTSAKLRRITQSDKSGVKPPHFKILAAHLLNWVFLAPPPLTMTPPAEYCGV